MKAWPSHAEALYLLTALAPMGFHPKDSVEKVIQPRVVFSFGLISVGLKDGYILPYYLQHGA